MSAWVRHPCRTHLASRGLAAEGLGTDAVLQGNSDETMTMAGYHHYSLLLNRYTLCASARALKRNCLPCNIPLLVRGGAVWQLVGLITRRSQVQILPPLPFLQLVRIRIHGARSWLGGPHIDVNG